MRDMDSEDWCPLAPRTLDYHMQRVVFAGVMADAAMVDMALDMDLRRVVPDAVGAGGGGREGVRARVVD